MVTEAWPFMEENGVAIISEKLGDLINGLDEEPFQRSKGEDCSVEANGTRSAEVWGCLVASASVLRIGFWVGKCEVEITQR
jgi:hypothetical protein